MNYRTLQSKASLAAGLFAAFALATPSAAQTGDAAAYSAAKAGAIGFTKALGKELAQSGVIVNCVTPSGIETELLGDVTPEYLDKSVLSKMPIGRLGQPEEAAAMIAWLASQDCSFSTGAVFDLSGGRAVY